jgi:hypothetical protein
VVPDSGLELSDPDTPGVWYQTDCGTGPTGVLGSPIFASFAPAAKPSAAPAVDPAVLAQQAVSTLNLPRPVLGLSPAAFQVVRVPTWLWVDPVVWKPVTSTVSVPGTTVTATATPESVDWLLGDGTEVVCRGPGTPYRPGGDPAAASPDCGHTYLVPSAGEPGGMFAVTARIHWSVAWHGGGRQGAFPDLVSAATRGVRVVEVQALVVRR